MSNTDTAKYLGPNALKILNHYRKIEPNNYWKIIRGWDFLSELNDKMVSQKRGGNGDGDGNRKRKRGDKKVQVRDVLTSGYKDRMFVANDVLRRIRTSGRLPRGRWRIRRPAGAGWWDTSNTRAD